MRLRILIGFLLLSQFGYAQSIVSLINRADAFFTTLSEGKFEEGYNYFDESVKPNISQDELKLFWLRLENGLGTYESVDGAQSRAQGDVFQVTLNCAFTKGSQAFTFVFNKSEKLVGFFVAPNASEAEYVAPAYADTTLYAEKEIFISFAGGQMAGLLTTPKNKSKFPVVIFVHGSGPADMDATVAAHKPFKDLAAGLAAKGIASIRYVKRTMVFPNLFTGAFTVKEEVIDDALTAISLAKSLPEIDKSQIYLLGHSLGGMLAPRISSAASDLKGIILAAAPARRLADLMAEQNEYLYRASGDTSAAMKVQFDEMIKEINRAQLRMLGDIAPDSVILSAPASYWVDLNSYDQVAVAKKLRNRIFVIQGGNDFQVSTTDFNLWCAGLNGNSNAAFKLYPEINHLLSPQTAKGTGAQYRVPGNVASGVIDDIAAWINAGSKAK